MRASKLSRVLRRDADAPTLKQRAEALRTSVRRLKRQAADLPALGSDEAKAAFKQACTQADRLMAPARDGYPELQQADRSWWTTRDLYRARDKGEIAPAEYARLIPLALEREHRMDAARITTNLDALFALAFPEEFSRPQVSEEPSPALAALMSEWQELEAAIPLAADDECEALIDRQTAIQQAALLFPSASLADLFAKLPLYRDELGAAAIPEDKSTLDVLAWRGVVADLERLLCGQQEPERPAVQIATRSDPIFQAIERQRVAYDALNAAPDEPEAEDAASAAEEEAWSALQSTPPTTLEGLVALTRALASSARAHDAGEGGADLLKVVGDRLSVLLGPPVQVASEPVACGAARIGRLIDEVSEAVLRADGEDLKAYDRAQAELDALRDAISQTRAHSFAGAIAQVGILLAEAEVAQGGLTDDAKRKALDNVELMVFSLAAFLRRQSGLSADTPLQRAFLPLRMDRLAILDRMEA